MRRPLPLLFFGLCAAAVACRPDFGDRESVVTSARILAVRADPPEAAPGKDVTLSVLVAAPEGTRDASLGWAFCATPKPLTENDVASSACFGDAIRPIGAGATARATLPSDACQLFGPEPPPGGYRPPDPDVTGGFYQPVRGTYEDRSSIALVRLTCKLASAPADAATELQARYRANANPTLDVLVPGEATAGAHVTLRASWRPEDAEAYVAFDAASQAVVDRREEMRVSWFTTAGALDSDKTGRAETEMDTFTENGWTAPDAPGTVHLWIVLRDSRGGIAWTSRDVLVR